MSFSVLDYGCGNSNMISIIEDSLSLVNENTRRNFTVNYYGFDPYLSEQCYVPKFKNIFINRSSDSIPFCENKFDMVVSFSVLEHVYDDISQLNLLNSISTKQVHYVPAACSLFAYLWHGYRVYDKYNLSKLLDKLSSTSSITVSPIGNLLSSLIYIFYTSIPDGIFIALKLLTGHRFHKDIFRKFFRSSYLSLFDKSVKSPSSFVYPAFLEITITNN